jgi:1-acyl-sn-glycerol-3-phosphate acyltransferase
VVIRTTNIYASAALVGLYGIYIVPIVIFCTCLIIAAVFKIPSLYRLGTNALFKGGFNLDANFEKIPDKPCILMANYCAKKNALDYFSNATIPHKFALILSSSHAFLVDRVYEKDRLIYVGHKSKDNYQKIKKSIQDHLKKGYYIFCYIEDITDEKRPFKIKKLRSGIFSIAKELSVPVVPIVMDSISHWFGLFTRHNYRIHVGDPLYVENVPETMKFVKRYMEKTLNVMALRY